MKCALSAAVSAALAPAACATHPQPADRVASGDSWEGIAARTGGLIPASELAVLNGFAAGSAPPAGQRIKTVIAGE